jgi:hypothetical protein
MPQSIDTTMASTHAIDESTSAAIRASPSNASKAPITSCSAGLAPASRAMQAMAEATYDDGALGGKRRRAVPWVII